MQKTSDNCYSGWRMTNVNNRIKNMEHFQMRVIFLFILVWNISLAQSVVEYNIVEDRELCPYYGLESNRYATVETGLVNCTWYTGKACCKRTEVTSVFSNMWPLFGASRTCKNHLNYLMCYFCDPNQQRWFQKKAQVCADFCRAVYTHCYDAQYEGEFVGKEYENGTAFCEAQNFNVVEGKSNCFNFDPTVFDDSIIILPNIVLMITLTVVAIFNFA